MANTWRRTSRDEGSIQGRGGNRSNYRGEEGFGSASGKRPKQGRGNAKASLMEMAHLPWDEEDEGEGFYPPEENMTEDDSL